jgi:hypothetical protein
MQVAAPATVAAIDFWSVSRRFRYRVANASRVPDRFPFGQFGMIRTRSPPWIIRAGLTLCRASPVCCRLPTCRRTAGVVSRIKCAGTVTLPVKPGAGGESEDSAHCDCASRRPKFISENQKFCFPFDPNQFYISRHPGPHGGAFRDRHRRRVRDAMDASGATDERAPLRTAKSCGPDASMVGVKFLRGELLGDDGDNKARSPGRVRGRPLKPSRAGMPDVPVRPW